MRKDLLTVRDITRDDLYEMFRLAAKLKAERGKVEFKPLRGKSIGMIFAKSSTRTRVSFEVGITELGGYSLYLDQAKLQVGRGETVADTARVLSRYLHGIIIRTYDHSDVEELGAAASVPVINALTNEFHPCQVLTDLFTIYEYSGRVEGVKLMFTGDGSSNMANSFILAAKLSGLKLVIASPEELKPDFELIGDCPNITWEPDPQKAVDRAEYIYTDVWVSMGFEDEAGKRFKLLEPYQVNMNLIKKASAGVKVLHCLPAHRGEEITDEAMDSEYSVVFDQAENRLHVQKAILTMLF